jgi:hypothetical protein
VVDTPEQASEALSRIEGRMEVLAAGRRDMINGEPGPDGYRDIKVNVNAGGVVAEVQVQLRGMTEAKHVAHSLYEQAQALMRQAKDREPTAQETARLQELTARQREIYDRAFAASRAAVSARATGTSLRNAASEIGAPLRTAEDGSNERGGSVSQASENAMPGSPNETGMPSTSRYSATETFQDGGGASDVSAAPTERNGNQPDISDSKPVRQAAGEARPEDEAAMRRGEQAAAAPPLRDDLVTPELQQQLADAEQAVARARDAGLLTAGDEAELAALDEDDEAARLTQAACDQASACIIRGLG